MFSPQEISIESTRYLYDADLLNKCRSELFAPSQAFGITDIQGRPMGRGGVQFFCYEGYKLVLRHYRRGGFVRHFVADRYLGLNKETSRSFREWRLLADLWQRGLPVPRPVAASFIPSGLCYRAALITVQLMDVRPLSSLLLDGDCTRDTWFWVGKTLRRFHSEQVFHADLNAHNILIDTTGKVFLIDFDRGRVRGGNRWKLANLNRLKHSVHKIAATSASTGMVAEHWSRLLEGYRQKL